MSTRSTTHFIGHKGETPEAIIYRHSDGYPEGHGRDLQAFFAAVEEQTQDTRFNDPSYLSAKLVVFLAREFATSPSLTTHEWTSHADTRPLDFISVGIVSKDPGDIEYRYVVNCGEHGEDGRPIVTCYGIGWNAPDTVVPIPA